MKKILVLLICFVMFMTSCQGTTPTTTTPTTTTPQTPPTQTIPETTAPKQDPAVLTQEYQLWIDNSNAYLSKISIGSTTETSFITTDSHYLCWQTSYLLHSIYRSYCATGDLSYLKNMATYLYRIFDLMADENNDGYLGWGASYENTNGKDYPYEEYLVHSGVILSMATDFVNIVYGDPTIANKSSYARFSYKDVADFIVDRAVNHVIPSFEVDWNDELGVYMNRPGCVNYSGATKPIALPNNQFLTIVPALINLAKICPEKRDEYLLRAEKLLATFKNNVDFKSNGTALWHYKDQLFSGDWNTSVEDYSHAQWDVRAAIYAYSSGLLFSLEEVSAFAKTYDTTMFMGTEEDPKLTYYINGSKKNDNGNLFLLHFDMAVYGEHFISRGKQVLINQNSTKGRDAGRILAFHPDTPIPRWFDLTLPANNAENVGSTEGFIWQRKAYANYYTLQIATDADFTNIIVNRDKILESSAIVKDLPASSTLYWRVIANNIAGDKIYSDTFSFKTK